MTDVYIASAARTPIGSFMGSLSRFTPAELGTIAAKEALSRAGVAATDVDSAVFAQVIPTAPQDAYLSRVIALGAGMDPSTDAMNVNRLCGSGVQAIISGAQHIASGDAAIALVGGAEVMSRAPHSITAMRKGKKLGNDIVYDWLTGTLACPFEGYAMGVTAENVVEKLGISRERQDAYALESQQRAAAAIAAGAFREQIVAVDGFDADEHPRETTAEKLAALKPTFKKDGTVTAGNSSGINDGAAALVLASKEAVQQRDLTPMARIVSWAVAGVAPEVMGLGPIDAVPKALKKAGLALEDIAVIESNEAFAAQAIAVADGLSFEPAKTNVNGGAVALGHPVGATGAILTTKTIYQLRERGGGYGLVTMCIGGGQGIALIVEAV